MGSWCCRWINRVSVTPKIQGVRERCGPYSVMSLIQFPASRPSEGKAPGWQMEID